MPPGPHGEGHEGTHGPPKPVVRKNDFVHDELY